MAEFKIGETLTPVFGGRSRSKSGRADNGNSAQRSAPDGAEQVSLSLNVQPTHTRLAKLTKRRSDGTSRERCHTVTSFSSFRWEEKQLHYMSNYMLFN